MLFQGQSVLFHGSFQEKLGETEMHSKFLNVYILSFIWQCAPTICLALSQVLEIQRKRQFPAPEILIIQCPRPVSQKVLL